MRFNMKLRICLLTLLALACSAKMTRHVQSCKVQRGEFHIQVVESGEVQATRSLNISSPAMSWRFGLLKITKIVDDGADVAVGDTVLLFDPSEVQKALIDAEAELEIAQAELEKMTAEQRSREQELDADIRVADISHQISEVELAQATYESEIKRKEIAINLEKAKISLGKARDEVENQKEIHREEQQQQRLKIRQLEANVADAEKTLENLTVTSQGSGVAIIRKNWGTGKKWQVGDQPWSGNPMIDLPDLSELQVETEINEVDISKIKLDQQVDIRLDAFSDTVLCGKVISIAALAQNKYKDDRDKDSKIKIFPVKILIDGTCKKLMPGMTVSCRIIVDKLDDVLFVPLEAVQKDGEGEYVYLKSSGGYEKNRVQVGQANNDYIVTVSYTHLRAHET